MNYEIIYSPDALTDLYGIYQYLAVDREAPERAAKLHQRLRSRIHKLSQMPERFRRYEKAPPQLPHLHIMPVGQYVVLYYINTRERRVIIVRILNGRRDIPAALHDTEP